MSSTNVSSPRGGISSTTILIIVVVGILLIIGGVLIGQLTPSLLPTQASAEARQIDDLFQVMLVIGGAIFLLVQGLLVFSIWRFRAKPGDTSDGIHMHGNTSLEITWTVIPAIIVVFLTVIAWQVWANLNTPRGDEMTVHVTGARFNWAFTYSAPLSIFPDAVDVSTLPASVQEDLQDDNAINVSSPVLHLYSGRAVALQMEPRDVIHAFWVPAFRLKQDLIPGRITTIHVTPVQEGTFPIKCAELCGANHGMMVGQVIVHADETAYNTWLVEEMRKVIYPPADPVVRGRNILSSNVYPCYTCHVLDDLAEFTWTGNVGPNLNGIADRAATSRASTTGLTPAEYLYTAVHEPGAYLAPGYGNLMPQLNIPECDSWAIVAYLATQSASGEAPFEVDQPPQCVITAGPGSAPAAEATSEATPAVAAPAEATAEATAGS
ncbi:MAG: cytochrome c oxidase subunit II [Anaerolineae bacterium]|nr:cytochrome c oxidase subunit II [Anaerolineae bacterium]